MITPEFAVVGHPNKGKSSIVATLAGDDSVAIGPEPGTTIRCRRYPLTVDGAVLYTLIDTPGFQRARKALAWLRQRAATPAERPSAVKAFVSDPQMQREFPDETELLRPIVDGAAILYVVDGSVPYNQEYEAELEILQWTGQPRMALINPISTSAHIEEWSAALGQYFSMVRVFNAVHAEFSRQVDLLRTFGELQPAWRETLTSGVDQLVSARRTRVARVAQAIADSIAEMLEYKTEITIPKDTRPNEPVHLEAYRKQAIDELYSGLRDIESLSRKRVETICAYHNLDREEPVLPLLDPSQLFSSESWRVFGLTQTEMLSYATAGGALLGSGIDAVTGGASMLAGTIIGGLLGFGSAFFSAGRLVDATVLSLPLGARVMEAGPVRSIEFPHLVFNRARLHYRILAFRTHARRDALDLMRGGEYGTGPGLTPLGSSEKSRLERLFGKLRGSSDSSPHGRVRQSLAAAIEDILLRDEKLGSADGRGV